MRRESGYEWNSTFDVHGLRASKEKTEVLIVNKATDECVNVTRVGFKLKQVQSFKYLGSMIDGRNKVECENKRRKPAAMVAW